MDAESLSSVKEIFCKLVDRICGDPDDHIKLVIVSVHKLQSQPRLPRSPEAVEENGSESLLVVELKELVLDLR